MIFKHNLSVKLQYYNFIIVENKPKLQALNIRYVFIYIYLYIYMPYLASIISTFFKPKLRPKFLIWSVILVGKQNPQDVLIM